MFNQKTDQLAIKKLAEYNGR